MEAIWEFIETALSSDATLKTLCSVAPSETLNVQRGFHTLPKQFKSLITYLGITSVRSLPTERHTYRITAWSAPRNISPDIICSSVINRIADIFIDKAFDETNFVVVNTEQKSKDEGVVWDEDKSAWRMDLILTFLIVKK